MADAGGAGPLDRIAGAAGADATAAFKLLSNETRLAILVALWEAIEPPGRGDGVPFSDLRERVGTVDSGQFNYHLDQLTDHYVRQTDAGYELSAAGETVVRAVIAGSGLGGTALEPSEIDVACNRCGARPVEVSYHDEAVHLTCGSCEGFIRDEAFPLGVIGRFDFDPAGLPSRTANEVLVAAWAAENNRVRTLVAGICPECSGTVERELRVCEDHSPAPDALCDECDRRDAARVRYVCSVCKYWNEGPVQMATIGDPTIACFYHEHGVDLGIRSRDPEGFERIWGLIWAMEHAVVSMDPLEIEVTVPCEGDELRLTLDADLEVRDVARSS